MCLKWLNVPQNAIWYQKQKLNVNQLKIYEICQEHELMEYKAMCSKSQHQFMSDNTIDDSKVIPRLTTEYMSKAWT